MPIRLVDASEEQYDKLVKEVSQETAKEEDYDMAEDAKYQPLFQQLLKGFNSEQKARIAPLLNHIIQTGEIKYTNFAALLEAAQNKPSQPNFFLPFAVEGISILFGLGLALTYYLFPKPMVNLPANIGQYSSIFAYGIAAIITGSGIFNLMTTSNRYKSAKESYKRKLHEYTTVWQNNNEIELSPMIFSEANESFDEPVSPKQNGPILRGVSDKTNNDKTTLTTKLTT